MRLPFWHSSLASEQVLSHGQSDLPASTARPILRSRAGFPDLSSSLRFDKNSIKQFFLPLETSYLLLYVIKRAYNVYKIYN